MLLRQCVDWLEKCLVQSDPLCLFHIYRARTVHKHWSIFWACSHKEPAAKALRNNSLNLTKKIWRQTFNQSDGLVIFVIWPLYRTFYFTPKYSDVGRVRCSLVHLQENVLVKGYRNNQKMNDNKDMYNTNLNVCSLQWGLDSPLERSWNPESPRSLLHRSSSVREFGDCRTVATIPKDLSVSLHSASLQNIVTQDIIVIWNYKKAIPFWRCPDKSL